MTDREHPIIRVVVEDDVPPETMFACDGRFLDINEVVIVVGD